MSVPYQGQGTSGTASTDREANLSVRQRSTKHLTRLVLTLYAKYATLVTETKRKELA